MFRAYELGFRESWDRQVALVKFSYNNSYKVNIGMAHTKSYTKRGFEPPYYNAIDDVQVMGIYLP